MSAKVGRMPMSKEMSSNTAAKEHTLVVTRDFISQPRISELICILYFKNPYSVFKNWNSIFMTIVYHFSAH